MYRIIVYLLFFFIAFTHSAVAMDIHVSNMLGQESASTQKVPSTTLSEKINSDGHDSLNEHCPHSSSHTSGIISSIKFPSVETQPAFISFVKTNSCSVSQSPPLRPPKA